MKLKNIIFLSLILFGFNSFGQFQDKDGKEVTSCDCKDPINYLDVVMSLPENYVGYDYIQFVLYAGGSGLSTRTMRPNDITALSIKLNVLNPENKAETTLLGVQYAMFHGDDFQMASYGSLCEFINDIDVHVVTLGITQIGTETVYEVDATRTKVISNTFNIYDDGVELSRSPIVKFVQDKDYSKKVRRQGIITYIAGAVTFVGAMIPPVIMAM